MKRTFLTTLVIFAIVNVQAQAELPKPNIIYIVIDDLNDYPEPFKGHPQVKTPNLNAIADSGTIFLNAFASSPVCAASRASIFTGKDATYTGILNNEDINCTDYSASFIPGNYIITLPQYLKDSAGYFTAGFDKIFHCDASSNEFDTETADVCAKTKSWNKFITAAQGPGVNAAAIATDEDITQLKWSKLDSSYESSLEDYACTDSVLQTLDDYFEHPELFCDRPLFLNVGYHLPHLPMYVTENYYPEYYQDDIYAEPFDKPYNDPANAYPYNGIVMPPQPQIAYSDYDHLGTLGKNFAATYVHNGFITNIEAIETLPIIEDGLNDEERISILTEAKRANAVMAYIASVQFVDAQVGRIIEKLKENPAVYNNSLIIISSDHGYSLGEKKHWSKRTLWETDLRVPLIITDVRNMQTQTCNSTVNLLDVFPTICDLAQINYPLFPGGENYLDGSTLVPFLQQPELNIEKPVLSTYRREGDEESSCFPQYSVRNNKYHYIIYRSNNGGDGLGCDYENSIVEEELYKIGKNREGDPNEWNNLINNEDYKSVIHYLQQWLPDSANYLQTAFTIKIHPPVLPCYLPNHGNIKLFPAVFNQEGNLLLGAGLEPYSFKWTNNITDEIFLGKIYNFNMASIPSDIFDLSDEILFNVEITEIATGALLGFNTKVVFINNVNIPDVAFDLEIDELQQSVDVVDYTINGTYDATHWAFGDGTALDEFWPATHYYASPDTYTISNTIDYGNGCQLTVNQNVTILRESVPENTFTVYPNPASKTVNIVLENPAVEVEVQLINVLGQTILKNKYDTDGNLIYLNVEKISAGSYILKINTKDYTASQKIEIF